MSRHDEETDQILVRNIQNGIVTEQSFQKLHDRYCGCLIRTFKRRGLRLEDATELTQEVFCRVFKGIVNFRGDSPFNSWLFEIAENLFKNEVRKWRAVKREAAVESLDAPAGGESLLSKAANLPSPEPGPWDLLAEKEKKTTLCAAFRQLPAKMRRCCILRYCDEHKYKDIAILMNISIETVKAHLHQARKRLSEELQSRLGPEREEDEA
jgi:RNA polymerase sigma-70 factor (ECF subfamily)